MAPRLGFGCELEMSPEAREFELRALGRTDQIKTLARKLRKRNVKAKAMDRPPSKYDRWWLTNDGSIKRLTSYAIKLECVSPVINFNSGWQSNMRTFWDVLTELFSVPKNKSCGTHVHVAPWKKSFTVKQAQTIAFACCYYEPYVVSCLPDNRRDHFYCQRNSKNGSDALKTLFKRKSMAKIAAALKRKTKFTKIRDFMQATNKDGRYVIWNFRNLSNKRKSTIEFRGGQHAQDAAKAERWITFAVVFVLLALKEDLLFKPKSPYKMADNDIYKEVQNFWVKFTSFARTLNVGACFPPTFKMMSERERE